MSAPRALLVIGIHREELAFGRAAAAALEPGGHDLLVIPEGLSGRHPRADERFHYDTLHRALYLQLLPHIGERHCLVIDLHTGLDERAPCADLYSREPARLAAILEGRLTPPPRCLPLGRSEAPPGVRTAIPPEIWNNPRFLYVGLEMYLQTPEASTAPERAYARDLLALLIQSAGRMGISVHADALPIQ